MNDGMPPEEEDEGEDKPLLQPDQPKFTLTEEEEHQIFLEVEKQRRIMELQRDFNHTAQTPQSVESEPALDSDEQTTLPVSMDGTYPAKSRHFLWLIDEGKRIQQALGVVVVMWAVVIILVPQLFRIEVFSVSFAVILLVTFCLTLIVCIVGILFDLRTYVRWRNLTLEVDEFNVWLIQKGVPWLGIDDDVQSLRRSRVETIRVRKRWFLILFDASIVTFDAAGNGDEAFHNLSYVRGGKHLDRLFKEKSSKESG
jgi:hypothetical protein